MGDAAQPGFVTPANCAAKTTAKTEWMNGLAIAGNSARRIGIAKTIHLKAQFFD